MKRGWVYYYRVGRKVYCGEHIGTTDGVAFFNELPFAATPECTSYAFMDEILWFKQVCFMTPALNRDEFMYYVQKEVCP